MFNFIFLISLSCLQDIGLTASVNDVSIINGRADVVSGEVFDQTLDILIVLDRSCSMDGDIDRLKDAMIPIYTELTGPIFDKLDWRIAARTATNSPEPIDRWVSWDDNNIDLKLKTILSPINISYIEPEQGLAAAIDSLTWDDEFYREYADALIIFMSDEDDHSIYSSSDYNLITSDIKSYPFILTESSIVTTSNSYDCSRVDDVGVKYIDVSEVSLSICDENSRWTSVLDNIKSHIPTLNKVWKLNYTPIDNGESIVVKVNEIEIDQYIYNKVKNQVELFESPATGSYVTIAYLY